MAIVKFPDLTLKLILDSILQKIKDDYVNSTDKNESFLGRLYNGLVIGNYNVLNNAVKVFNWSKDDPNKIDTRLMFDRERANIPTIHVNIPSETPYGDGIGMDEGFQSVTENEDGETLTEYFTRSYNARFELLVTGANDFEVVVIHNTLKIALINNVISLEANGFSNVKIYGNDLMINTQLTPTVFMRVIYLDCNFDLNVPKFNTISIVNDITFDGTAYG